MLASLLYSLYLILALVALEALLGSWSEFWGDAAEWLDLCDDCDICDMRLFTLEDLLTVFCRKEYEEAAENIDPSSSNNDPPSLPLFLRSLEPRLRRSGNVEKTDLFMDQASPPAALLPSLLSSSSRPPKLVSSIDV